MKETPLMTLHVEIDREADGRWLAEIVELPGAMAYGLSRDEALASVKALALRVLADRLVTGELRSEDFADVHFDLAAA
ncbi:MAG: type II toxin-antitoxin system HicB family antitoxin [Planctomycetota bacterium]